MDYAEKSDAMDKVIATVMEKYDLATRAEAYPYIVGAATIVIDERGYKTIMDGLTRKF